MRIDSRDIACLGLLQQDAEMPVQAIADRVALSPSATSRRITQLREAGFIRRVVALLDRGRLCVPTTVFLILAARPTTFFLGVWVLVVSVLVDGVLFCFVPKITVCYKCRAEFRDVPVNPEHGGFELAVGEKYRAGE